MNFCIERYLRIKSSPINAIWFIKTNFLEAILKNKNVTMTPGWPCNKSDLTLKGTTLYSAAMTPGKHGPQKYP